MDGNTKNWSEGNILLVIIKNILINMLHYITKGSVLCNLSFLLTCHVNNTQIIMPASAVREYK